MIPFNFIYCRPTSVKEAIETYSQLKSEGKNAVYYAGGTETITMCRTGSIRPDVVIDIKNVPECLILNNEKEMLSIGAACSLTRIKESNLFPLLGLACGRIADHSNQCRITLGGNLCGTIIYRESSLPLLLSDAKANLYGPEGKRSVPFQEIFQGKMQLKAGELLAHVEIPTWALHAKHAHIKKTTNEKIDYPLVSFAVVWEEDFLRIAFSGICSFPFRNEEIESVLNDHNVSCENRAKKAVSMLPELAYCDVEGSSEYRCFIFKNTLQTLLEEWEDGKI